MITSLMSLIAGWRPAERGEGMIYDPGSPIDLPSTTMSAKKWKKRKSRIKMAKQSRRKNR